MTEDPLAIPAFLRRAHKPEAAPQLRSPACDQRGTGPAIGRSIMDKSDNVTPLRPRGAAGADERFPDPGLRQLCIEWIRKIQNPNADVAEVCRIANGIVDTPATSKTGVSYKVAAAAMTAEVKLGAGHPITEFLMSAVNDDNRLAGNEPAEPPVQR